jgi:uncharacterized protein (DUF3820 family)
MVHLTGESRITFGMYRGTKLKDLPPGYLLFLLDKKKLFDQHYIEYVEKNKATLEAEKKRAMKARYK